MKTKLYANMKRLTTGFCLGILATTLSVLGLRFTVFSDMAAAPEKVASNYLRNEDLGYQFNGAIHFSDASAKGDVFITNLNEDKRIMLDITLADSGVSILSTGQINPGLTANSFPLNPKGKELADGVYRCVAEVTARDVVDAMVVGTAREEIEVYIGIKPEKNK